ncbi:hypothetical protein [Psychroflexus tropicus]|uniref:hypothetical protein n=1 Tax=Psychroflexus tropicus TaxID=197345 RepID=UPI00037A7CEE|nr:hypothetical protein [Psychroflexus tropicus]
MEQKIKSGKEVIDEFFSEILNIEGVDEKTVEMLVKLYSDDKLTDTNIQNELDELKISALKTPKEDTDDKN